MRRQTFVRLTIGLLIAAGTLRAQGVDPKFSEYLGDLRALLPVDGELLYDCSRVSGYVLGSAMGSSMTRFAVAAAELPFTQAYRVKVVAAGENSWEPQFMTPNNKTAINRGDMLFWCFYARTVQGPDEDSGGRGFFYAQLSQSPWSGIVSADIVPPESWTQYYVYQESPRDFAPGEMGVTVHLGFFPQIIEFGGFVALNLGADVSKDDLPDNPVTYEGRDAAAPWRSEAQASIEQHRKADLTVAVRNRNGKAVKGASLQIKMREHAFHFGSFLDGPVLENSSFARNYRDEFLKLFNAATTPFYMGDGSWGWYGSEWTKTEYRNKAEWLKQMGFHAKGHVLIWPGWNYMSPFFKDLADRPDDLHEALLDHLRLVVPIGRTAGLEQWDVVNEPYTNHDVMDILGDQVLVDWFELVHELHPEARLVLNETGVIVAGGDDRVLDNLVRLIGLLKAADAPLGGIGVQGHFGSYLTAPVKVYHIIDRLWQSGTPVQVTEFDIDIDYLEAQADYTRDFLTVIFSHPGVDKFIMWGFQEDVQWRPRGAMIRRDWSCKPNYDAYTDLIFRHWWTEVCGATGADGTFSARGFLGRYTVSAQYNGVTAAREVELVPGGVRAELVLETEETGVADIHGAKVQFRLWPNYPNPFNPCTTFSVQLERQAKVELTLFDARGRLVRTLAAGSLDRGLHAFKWGGRDSYGRPVGAGVYFARFKALSGGEAYVSWHKAVYMK